MQSILTVLRSRVVNAGGSCWISGNCLQGDYMQAKTGEAADSFGLNHLVWHQLLDPKASKSFSLSIRVISQSVCSSGKISLSMGSSSSSFTFAKDKTPMQRASRKMMLVLQNTYWPSECGNKNCGNKKPSSVFNIYSAEMLLKFHSHYMGVDVGKY